MRKFSNKNLYILLTAALLFSSCTSIKSIIPSPFKDNTPASIQEAISTRVNPETQIYALGNATLKKSGSIVAQSVANKKASDILKKEVKEQVSSIFDLYLENMDAFSKSVVKPVTSDLNDYATGLIMKKVSQKGAWQDVDEVYSLLVLDKKEIEVISEKVLKNFVVNAAKNLEKAGGAFINTRNNM